jgi:hypothetical protein
MHELTNTRLAIEAILGLIVGGVCLYSGDAWGIVFGTICVFNSGAAFAILVTRSI